jgi:Holliday junction resolvasome RuvABC endonuclease subunit
MKTVAALDLSFSGTGVIILDESAKTLVRETIKTTTAETDRQRLVKIGDTVVSLLLPFNPVMILKEGPAHNARFGVHLAGRGHGAVDYAMEKANMPTPLEVAPATLKKFATGRGVGEKGDIKMWVLEKWHEKFSDNNQSDAYVLARMAGVAAGFFPMTSRHEGECLKTVLKSGGLEAQAKAIKLKGHDDRVCSCGKKMKTGIEMESGRCAECIRTKPVTEGGIAQ